MRKTAAHEEVDGANAGLTLGKTAKAYHTSLFLLCTWLNDMRQHCKQSLSCSSLVHVIVLMAVSSSEDALDDEVTQNIVLIDNKY